MKKIVVQRKKLPKILLIGSGSFGRNHIRVLKELATQKKIDFIGVLVRDGKKREIIKKEFGVETFGTASPNFLKQIDAVDIATPPETHFELVKKCLCYTNVFVEKPLAMNEVHARKLEEMAKMYKRNLTTGHIFRFHPVTEKLKKLLQGKAMPKKITGSFINPIESDKGREPSLELLHLFDVVDFLWDKQPKFISARKEKRISVIDLRYGGPCDTRFILGWLGDNKKRIIKFIYPNYVLEANFISNSINIIRKTRQKTYACPIVEEPLHKELSDFIRILEAKKNHQGNSSIGARVVSVAEKAIPKQKSSPRIAVIGGGIFGTSIAAELGKFASVTLFEKNSELMREGSLINCFRHHYGYHYPRSDETVVDVQRSRADFEEIYENALIRTIPTYYGLAKKGSFVNVREFITFCKKHALPYELSYPSGDLLLKKEMDLCIEVPEPSYHYEKLKKITDERLAAMPNVDIVYNTIANKCTLEDDSSKILTFIKKGGTPKKQKFDFVINATYANINRFAHWLGFEKYPLRVDLAEVLILKLPIDPVSITVIDGPFATLMPTGNPNEFTLYHVTESILDRYVPLDGLLKKPRVGKSNAEAIFKESLKFFPILKKAEIVESRIVHRGVIAHREHDDIRVADLIEHGFGCWSILSGKILSSVTTAKRIAEIIRHSVPEQKKSKTNTTAVIRSSSPSLL